MIDERKLQEAVQRIVAVAQPSRVILFGSYGRGDAAEDSDLDLIVIEPNVDNRYEEMVRLRKAVGHIGVGVDVLVYSETEYDRRSQVPGTVLYWARKEGRPLYEYDDMDIELTMTSKDVAGPLLEVRKWAETQVNAAAQGE